MDAMMRRTNAHVRKKMPGIQNARDDIFEYDLCNWSDENNVHASRTSGGR